MLLSKQVEVTLMQSNIGHYRKMGYGDIMPTYKDSHYRIKVKVGTKIMVNVDHLPRYSEYQIDFSCDYCGKLFKKTATNYFTTVAKNLVIKKDACINCKEIKLQENNLITKGYATPFCNPEVQEKNKEIFMEKYGVINPFMLEEVKEKSRQTLLAKYGVDNSSKVEEVRQKAMKTVEDRYGVKHVMHNKEINAKARRTLYENNSAPASNQQKYIHKLIGGELNYPEYTSSLDIAFPDDKIYIEYFGGGHELSVKFGDLTKEEFDKKERKRWYTLYRKGWKEIRITSKSDKLPSDEILLNMFSYAKEYLSTDRHYINFDIDNNKIISSQFERDYDYGQLRLLRRSKTA